MNPAYKTVPILLNNTDMSPKETQIGLIGNTRAGDQIKAIFVALNTLSSSYYVRIYLMGNDDTTNIPPLQPAASLIVGNIIPTLFKRIQFYTDSTGATPYVPTSSQVILVGLV